MNVEDVKKVAVFGAGLMGNGIAQVCAQAGLEVALVDIEDRFVESGMKNINRNLQRGVDKGRLSAEQMQEIMGRINGSTSREVAKDADVIIEAIIENENLKKELYAELDTICPEHTIFASNTSSISITAMASVTKRQEKFIGMHFFNPVPVMKLVEIIRGFNTSDETHKLIEELSKKIGKDIVTVNEAPGFAVNRILIPFMLEAIFAIQEGVCTVEDLDKSIKLGLNHPMGPLTLLDFVGLDTTLYIADYMFEEFKDSKYRAPALLRKMVRAGNLGRKSGKGFYDYKK